MINEFDLQRLRAIPVEQVAEACGLHVRAHKSLCPFHNDTVPSLTYSRKSNLYRCYVCDSHGSTISLVMHMMNLKFFEACHWLSQTFGISIEDSKEVRKFNNIQPRKVVPFRPLKEDAEGTVDVRHLATLVCQPYISDEAKHFLEVERKIKPEVIKRLGLSSITSPVPMSGNLNGSWFNAPSLLIPYRDIDGKLVSVQARYLGNDKSKPRFQFPKASKCSIFNIQVLKEVHNGDPVFITEGVTDALAMQSAGYPAIAIPSATLLTERDKQTLLSLSSSLKLQWHMYPDRDAPGERLFLDLKALLPNLKRHQLPEGFKDIGQYWAAIHKT